MSAVPVSRLHRAYDFASLGASLYANRSNASASGDILTAALCRLRGGALKLGQMLSIQEESLLPKEWTDALQRVRTGADAMPAEQVSGVMNGAYRAGAGGGGDEGDDWRAFMATVPGGRGLKSFDERPIAAASIGQVHRGRLYDGTDVVVKIQYPGVAGGIESDLKNLEMLIRWGGFVPKGVFISEIIKAGREELSNECDYNKEASNQVRFQSLVASDPELKAAGLVVPSVVPELTRTEVLVTTFAPGSTIDAAVHLPQAARDRIARAVLRLTLLELFSWRFMQTDPNWGNFLFDHNTGKLALIDFGGARTFDRDFVDGYLSIVWAAANRDVPTIMSQSIAMGFLNGQESEVMLDAHRDAALVLGEPFRLGEDGSPSPPFPFEHSRITQRIAEHATVFTKHRLVPPPPEVYTLHRKLAGAFLLCVKLKASIRCRDILEEVWRDAKKAEVDGR